MDRLLSIGFIGSTLIVGSSRLELKPVRSTMHTAAPDRVCGTLVRSEQ